MANDEGSSQIEAAAEEAEQDLADPVVSDAEREAMRAAEDEANTVDVPEENAEEVSPDVPPMETAPDTSLREDADSAGGVERKSSISRLYTGSTTDYAQRDERGNIVNGPSLLHRHPHLADSSVWKRNMPPRR